MAKLTDSRIKALKAKDKQYWEAGENGLYVLISKIGSKHFYYRGTIAGKRTNISIGEYPIVSLAEAANQASRLRAKVKQGIDPREEKLQLKQTESKLIPFKIFGERYFTEKVISQRERSAFDIRRILDKELYPALGDMHLGDITKSIIWNDVVGRKKANGHPAQAEKIRGVLKRLFDYAFNLDLVDANPVLKIKREDVFIEKSRNRYLKDHEIQTLFKNIYASNMNTQFKYTLHLLLITMVRKGELINAKWEHIDFDKKEWIIPSENMKTKKEHVVYLSDAAITIFKKLKYLAGNSPYILPGKISRDKPFHITALNQALKCKDLNLGIDNFVIHDLRRTASTLLHNHHGELTDAIEMAMAHEVSGKVRRTYNRAEYKQERIMLLNFLAKYVEDLLSQAGVVDNFMGEINE